MVSDAGSVREGRPVIALSRTDPASVEALVTRGRSELARHRRGALVPADPGPMAPHFHADGTSHTHDHQHA